jgi:hypothetical protein
MVFSELFRTYLKKRILVQGEGGAWFQPAGILQYVEDLKPGTNTQIGPKDFFEIGSSYRRSPCQGISIPAVYCG